MSATSAAATTGLAEPGRPAAVTARGVVRRYRNRRGVGPVDVEVCVGETVALMGRNGCGKTTLLRVLATVMRPQRGRLSWYGGGVTRGRSNLGLALDGALEDGGLTGRQATNFWCAQWIADGDDARARTGAVLARLGLGAAADDRVVTYSYGMRRRLALAAALVHDPALALLDEPTAGLDPDGCADLATLIAQRSARGRSTVIASNDPAFVEAVADRVTFMDEGVVLRSATPAELLATSAMDRVAELVTDGPCDVVELRRLPGVLGVTVEGARTTVRFAGDHTVAALVAAADHPGGRLRELRLRRRDLADCFHELTGQALVDRQ